MSYGDRSFLVFLLLVICITGSADLLYAGKDAAELFEFPKGGRWFVVTADGEKLLPQTLNVTAEGWLMSQGDDVRRLQSSEIFSVMHTRTELAGDISQGAVSRLHLSNGDRLVGQLVTLSESALELTPLATDNSQEMPGLATGNSSHEANRGAATVLKIPLESVRALEWARVESSPLHWKDLTIPNAVNHDVLLLSNGDQLTGDLTTIALDNLGFQDDQGSRMIPVSEVRAVFFNPELLLEPEPATDYSRIALTDGSLLTLRELKLLNYNRFEMQTQLAGSYQIPIDALVSVSTFSRSRVPLSQRTPSQVNYTPYLASIPRWQADRNVKGAPLIMTGGRYLTGVGVHSRTEITWPLKEGDTRFLADVGVDDSTEGRGNVIFSVLLDGAAVFTSGPVSGGELPRTINVDLRGKKTLTLLVDFGQQGDVLDRADWGHAVIVRD